LYIGGADLATFEDIIKKKQKDWGSSIMDIHSRDSKIPLSSPQFVWSLYGGIPRNKMTEFFGAPGGGKSTSAIDVCKNAVDLFKQEFDKKLDELRLAASKGNKQAALDLEDAEEEGPKKVFYLDLEHSFDEEWSKVLGINSDEIYIMQPPDKPAEEILQMIQEMVETGEVGLIVIDSIPSLVPQAELDKKYGERTVASLAGLLTVFCRKMTPLLTRYQCTLLVINQVRDNMDNPYVVKTPGGEALKFYCSLRVEFRQGNPVDFLGNELPMSTEDPAGYIIKTKIHKQKSAPNNRKSASYFLMCTKGIMPMFDYAQLAIKRYNIISKSGGWFTLTDPETGEILQQDGKTVKINGLARVYQYLEDNPEYYEKIQKFIMDDLNNSDTEVM
jgi:recombination protein RecA